MIEKVSGVPYFSFLGAPSHLREEWLQKFKTVIDHGVFIKGPEVEIFESRWASMLRTEFAIGVSNGQDGLILALRSIGVKAFDKVVVPAHSFIATHNAIISIGAIPISVDVNHHGLIDANKLDEIQEEVTAVIVVHLHGQVCDMDAIVSWASKRQIKVVEDASQAHLATLKGKAVGTIGDVGVFSLYPTKNLGALGDAGVVVTDSEAISTKIRTLSNYGNSQGNKYKHEAFGLNNRLDEIQAAVLNVNLKYLESWNNRRAEISNQYFEGLRDSGLEFLQAQKSDNVWHHFCVLHPERDRLQRELGLQGIGTEIHYPRLAAVECQSFSEAKGDNYPMAEKIARQTISLPMSQWHSSAQIDFVIEKLKSVLSNF